MKTVVLTIAAGLAMSAAVFATPQSGVVNGQTSSDDTTKVCCQNDTASKTQPQVEFNK